MLAIPHVGGSECVAVLERLGWHRDREARGVARLSREGCVVRVPEAATLGPAVLDAILLATATDPLEFLRVLATLRPAA